MTPPVPRNYWFTEVRDLRFSRKFLQERTFLNFSKYQGIQELSGLFGLYSLTSGVLSAKKTTLPSTEA